MKLSIYSYRYAREILEHPTNAVAWHEINSICEGAPVFRWPGKSKSKSNTKRSILQKMMNAYFDRRMAVDHGWTYHPLATSIVGSELAADFRKKFASVTVQAEVQFGNISRWYSDIFKFQTAYSQSLIQMGLCIVPHADMAREIDSNIVSFERVLRELPAAEMSITLPILVIGLQRDTTTPDLDVRTTGFSYEEINGKKTVANRHRVVHAFLSGGSIAGVNGSSPTGPMPTSASLVEPDADDEDDGDTD